MCWAPQRRRSKGPHLGSHGPWSPGAGLPAAFPPRMLFCVPQPPRAPAPIPNANYITQKEAQAGQRPTAWPGTRQHFHTQKATLGADTAKLTAFNFFSKVSSETPTSRLPSPPTARTHRAGSGLSRSAGERFSWVRLRGRAPFLRRRGEKDLSTPIYRQPRGPVPGSPGLLCVMFATQPSLSGCSAHSCPPSPWSVPRAGVPTVPTWSTPSPETSAATYSETPK